MWYLPHGAGSFMVKSRILLAAGLIILAIAGGTGLYSWPYLGRALKLHAEEPTPTPVVLPSEIAQTTHRVQARLPKQINTQSNPWGIAIDHTNGFIWVAVPQCDINPRQFYPPCPARPVPRGYLSKYALSDGSLIQEFLLREGFTGPLFVAVNTDGHVWFTQPSSDAIGELDPFTSTLRQIQLSPGSVPYDLVFDKNGNLWFTEYVGSRIGFINTKTRQLVETPTPIPYSEPYGITRDPDGNIWFAENAKWAYRLGTFTPTRNGQISIVEYPIVADQLHLVEADAQGNIWFTTGFKGSLGVFSRKSHFSRLIKVNYCYTDACTHISGIAVDQKGNIWFTDSLGQLVGYYNPKKDEVVAKILDQPNLHPHDGLVVDEYGTVWFTQQFGSLLTMWPEGRLPK
jgi:virginiamycin B lyase